MSTCKVANLFGVSREFTFARNSFIAAHVSIGGAMLVASFIDAPPPWSGPQEQERRRQCKHLLAAGGDKKCVCSEVFE